MCSTWQYDDCKLCKGCPDQRLARSSSACGVCRSEIEECADADVSRMQARLSYVSIAALPGYTSKRLLVRTRSSCLHPACSRWPLHWHLSCASCARFYQLVACFTPSPSS